MPTIRQLPHRLRPMAHQLHQQLLPVRILQRLEQRNALVEDFQAPDRLVTCPRGLPPALSDLCQVSRRHLFLDFALGCRRLSFMVSSIITANDGG